MNLLIIGSGAREHSFVWKIFNSKHDIKIFATNPNAGISKISICVDVDINDFVSIKKLIINHSIDIVLIGPEIPLINGIADFINNDSDLKDVNVIGPSQKGSMLEGSKEFAKNFMAKYNIPTASYKSFDKSTFDQALSFINKNRPPYVLKADGPAAGKGVIIVNDPDEAAKNLEDMLLNSKFGKSSEKVVIEEFMSGIEMSCFVLFDGKNYKILPYAKDYKRIGEGDKGLNTGGMGSISPVDFLDENLKTKIKEEIIEPTIHGLISEKIDYVGFIFIGLINVDGQPKVIEYNVRMGDPECQTILPRLKTDIADIFFACCGGTLNSTNIQWHEEKSLCIVLCSKGYPDKYQNNLQINNLDKIKLDSNEFIYHAGTKFNVNNFYSNGGRVLNFVVLSNNFKTSRDNAIKLIKKIDWQQGYYRRDIGFKVIK